MQSKFLGPEQDGVVVGVFWPLPSGPLSISLAATPLHDYDLMNVFHVVYKVICAPHLCDVSFLFSRVTLKTWE